MLVKHLLTTYIYKTCIYQCIDFWKQNLHWDVKREYQEKKPIKWYRGSVIVKNWSIKPECTIVNELVIVVDHFPQQN